MPAPTLATTGTDPKRTTLEELHEALGELYDKSAAIENAAVAESSTRETRDLELTEIAEGAAEDAKAAMYGDPQRPFLRQAFTGEQEGDPLAVVTEAPGAAVTTTDLGQVLRLRDADVVASLGFSRVLSRRAMPVAPGRIYAARLDGIRRDDPPSPADVQLRVQSLDGNYDQLGNEQVSSAQPTVAGGRLQLVGRFSLAAGQDVQLPTGTVYVRLEARVVGTGQIFDLAVLEMSDVTDAGSIVESVQNIVGGWDADAGTFPGGGAADTGDTYIVSTAGTVDSVAFALGDKVIALVDNASATTYAGNWIRDPGNGVASVNGETGVLTGFVKTSGAQTLTGKTIEDGAIHGATTFTFDADSERESVLDDLGIPLATMTNGQLLRKIAGSLVEGVDIVFEVQVADFDVDVDGSVVLHDGGSVASNSPDGLADWTVQQMYVHSGTDAGSKVQFGVNRTSGRTAVRNYNGTTWSTWDIHARRGPDHKPMVPEVGTYFTTAAMAGDTTTQAGVADRITIYPWVCAHGGNVDKIGIQCTTGVASAQARIVIYETDIDERPSGSPFFESPTPLDLSTSEYKEEDVALTLQRGMVYWVGVHHSSTATISVFPADSTPNIPGAQGTTALKTMNRGSVAFAGGAPDPWVFNSAEASVQWAPAIWMRKAA